MNVLTPRHSFPGLPLFPLQSHLVLVPYFQDRDLLGELRRSALLQLRRLGGEWLNLADLTLITGFLGYPALFTHLAFLGDSPPARISFLGTAGSLSARHDAVRLVQVRRIMGSGPLRGFSRSPVLEMGVPPMADLDPVTGVSVDMVQRETPGWLRRQRARGAEIVEMELFPLRARLQRHVAALVVLTDRVTEKGIRPFRDPLAVKREFRRGWLALSGPALSYDDQPEHP